MSNYYTNWSNIFLIIISSLFAIYIFFKNILKFQVSYIFTYLIFSSLIFTIINSYCILLLSSYLNNKKDVKQLENNAIKNIFRIELKKHVLPCIFAFVLYLCLLYINKYEQNINKYYNILYTILIGCAFTLIYIVTPIKNNNNQINNELNNELNNEINSTYIISNKLQLYNLDHTGVIIFSISFLILSVLANIPF